MNQKEYDKLKKYKPYKNIIETKDLQDRRNRTLLYGYTLERNTWHVYLYDGKIYTVTYEYEQQPKIVDVYDNRCYVPDKRLYPERCDYEFCELLINRGLDDLPFTCWSDDIKQRNYYGELLKEHCI